MKILRYSIPVIFLICIAAYGGYTIGEHKKLKDTERQFELLTYGSFASDIKTQLKLFNLIQSKKFKEAENFLEMLIDINLASLSLYDELSTMYPDKEIFDVISSVKKHRVDNVNHKVNDTLKSSVERALRISK